MNDIINSPRHYNKGNIEVDDFIDDQRLNFRRGNVVKYTCRAGDKVGPDETIEEATLRDLKKAHWYISKEIRKYEELVSHA